MGNIHSKRQLNMMVKWSQPSLLTLVCLYNPLFISPHRFIFTQTSHPTCPSSSSFDPRLGCPKCDFCSCSFFFFLLGNSALSGPTQICSLIDFVGRFSDRFLFNLCFYSRFSHFSLFPQIPSTLFP